MIHLIVGAVVGGLALGGFAVGIALILEPTKTRRGR